ncbi:MAG: response regulator [Rubrivivax sp.]|nr:response regulator [Rubrivivax sp.]
MSIRSRLLWLTLLAILLPALLQLARYLQERERTIEADSAQLMLLAQRHVNAIDERIQGTAQLLFGLARAQDLASADRAACSAFLSQVREAYPQYTGILTIRPDGRLFCDSLNSGRELDLRDRGYFQAALKARDQVVLEPVFGRLTGTAVLQIAYPVRSAQGELQFVLLASLSLPKLLEGLSLPVPGAELLLLSDLGQVLATTRRDPGRWQPGNAVADSPVFALVRQQPGRISVIPGVDGAPMVWAVVDDPATRQARLHVLASAPQRLLVAQANRRFMQDLGVLAAAAVAIFAAMWLLTERVIRRQISRIAHMATELAAGRLSTRLHGPLPRGELGALMGVLNQTAEALEQQGTAITELNERLRRSQRLEAVGQLTGGVAHDFNNLLTVVMGNAELLVEMNADRPAQRQLAEMIVSAAQRGAELTQRLLAFARKQALDPKVVDLNELVAGMDGLLRRSLGEHIEIELIRGAGLWPALVDQGQLENALLNLCLNARDAMPGGGRLTLETANARLDADYAAHHSEVNPGQYTMLAVSDTGAGIAPEHLQRVFEPFFTTKEKGKGTGLGLAMVYGFCKQSGGHVTVYSEPGDGTTVRLYLPRAAARPGEPAPSDPRSTEVGTRVVGGHETILVVEDDAAVRQYACTQLKASGYRVLEAADGPSALALLGQRDDVELLFTDVVMPGGMNGRALADAARRLRQGLRVLYTSGYTENAIVHHGRLDPDALLLSKPYRRQALDRAVRTALAQAMSPPG